VSRIGKIPIVIPKDVDVQLGPGPNLAVKGPKGSASLDYRDHVVIKKDDGALHVARKSDERQDRAYHGLYQRLLVNMVKGVTLGFQKDLDLIGVGYRAAMDGQTLVLNLGYSHEIHYQPKEGIKIATPKPTQIVVTGVDKQRVGQAAAEIRAFRPPEPYKGKGIRYTGEKVRRKVGKAGVK